MFFDGHVPDVNPERASFQLLKVKLKAEGPTNKQHLKAAAVKAWQVNI